MDPENRQRGRLRTMRTSLGHLSRVDGSSIFQAGMTQVWASISGPGNAPSNFLEPDRIAFDVQFTTNFDQQKNEIVDAFIERVLEKVVECDLHPHTALTVSAQVLQEDGSMISAALNAISLALLDSAVSCNSVMCGVQLSKDQDGRLHLDPKRKEETGDFIVFACKATREAGATTISSLKFGTWNDELSKAAEEMALAAASEIFGFFREAFQRQYRNDIFSKLADLSLTES
ncbi:unnamed protein product, partial [Mesorhabditis belari]|uniref:Exoribonuclease phosphorolytic domain-containing protein n=1 Tax=Mesorhabditis belari TaxID=2138241 RepID=A0AAF3JAR1_9BILA